MLCCSNTETNRNYDQVIRKGNTDGYINKVGWFCEVRKTYTYLKISFVRSLSSENPPSKKMNKNE